MLFVRKNVEGIIKFIYYQWWKWCST